MINKELIYIDFEGRIGKKPTFVGFKQKNDFKQIAFEPLFSSNKISKENRLEYKDFKDFLKEIISADKMIVHFTQHEVQLFESNLGLKMEPEKFMDIHKL